MIYHLHRRRNVQLVDWPNDLGMRQVALADQTITMVETADGRVVYRRVPPPRLPEPDRPVIRYRRPKEGHA